jgi:hypothetical protein
MRIIIELDNSSAQPNVQVHGGNDTTAIAPHTGSAINAGAFASTPEEKTMGDATADMFASTIPESVRSGSTDAGAAPAMGSV